MAVAQARFAGVWFNVADAQLYTMALLPNRPQMYKKDAKYRAGTFKVDTVMMKPVIAKQSGTEMCQPRSLFLSLEVATANETSVASRYGGAVQTSVMVVDPRWKPLTMVGKKLLNPYAL